MHTQSEIVVRLNSGLGNQLFQLAQGMSLADRKHARLSFDTTWFRIVSGLHPVKRRLRISELGVPIPESFRGPRRLAVGLAAAFFEKTRHGKIFLSALGKMRVVQEETPPLSCDQEILQTNAKRIYLSGYWQTNRPFTLVRGKLLPQLKPRSPLSKGAQSLIAKADSGSTGFIHVRRGDYIRFMGETGTLSVHYYQRALAKLQAMGKKITNWLVFSEDGNWARANLGFVPNSEVVDYESPHRDIEDLMVMKSCCSGIIANSSYSWWGAALGDRPDRPIIAPNRYWQNAACTTKDWCLPHWHQADAWPNWI